MAAFEGRKIWILEAPRASTYILAMMLLPSLAWAQEQTTIVPTLPSLTTGEKSADDPDAAYCRPPQHLTDSRLMGPKVCMPNRQWHALHAQGLDISPDGKTTVSSQIGIDILTH
jgi:hypothetical protein